MKSACRRMMFLIIFFIVSGTLSYCQTRYAVLPFQNMEGKIDLNIWSYQLQDSLQKAILNLEEKGKFQVVSADSVEDLLAELNMDPTNPQYQSDLWKAVKMLNVEKVITGNFYLRGDKLLVNAYIYDVRTKMADPRHQAKNIFKSEEEGLSAVNVIVQKLKPLLLK